MPEKTVSIWSYLNSQKEKYINRYYIKDDENSILTPSSHQKYLRLWEEYFLRYSPLSKPLFKADKEIEYQR